MLGHIWLIGMMGSGKSSTARALASRLERDAIDTDDIVAERMGCSIAEFWGSHGEEAFRDMEAAAVTDLATRQPLVIATGGGVVLRPENVQAMRDSGIVIWLEAAPATLARRVGNSKRRPLLAEGDSRAVLADLLRDREAAYRSAAHAAVATDRLRQDVVVDRIEELWNAS